MQAVQERPDFFLMIGGAGGQESEISRFSKNTSNVEFLGYVHPNNVPLYTAVADIIYYGLNPADSQASNSSSNKLFEALAAGKALLASDTGGELSRIVRSAGCGVLIPVVNKSSIGEALDKLVDPILIKVLAENARFAGQSTYNWKIASQQLIDAYRQIYPIKITTKANL